MGIASELDIERQTGREKTRKRENIKLCHKRRDGIRNCCCHLEPFKVVHLNAMCVNRRMREEVGDARDNIKL
jgi:hypothetical protein